MHIHTPASHDVPNDLYTPEELIEKAIQCKVDVLGITDHNNVKWIDKVRNANQKNGSQLTIFPGVELDTKDGIHVLVYFDPNIEISKLTDFLHELGIHEQHYHVPTQTTSAILNKFEEFYEKIKEFSGFLIFAHIKSNPKSLLIRAGGTEFSKNELKNYNCPFEVRKEIKSEIMNTHPGRAIIIKTDFHTLEEFDNGDYTWIKFGNEITLESLKQISYDPSLRIDFEVPQIKHPFISKLILPTSYFHDNEIDFNPFLNVIIGGRGTGKSVIIESIDFVFQNYSNPALFNDKPQYYEKLNKIFIGNEKISIEINYDTQSYRLSRIFKKFPLNKKWKSDPKKLQDDIQAYDHANIQILEQYIDDSWEEIQLEPILTDLYPQLFTQSCVKKIGDQSEKLLSFIEQNTHLSTRSIKYEKNKIDFCNLLKKISDIEDLILDLYSKLSIPEEIEHDIQKTKNEIEGLNARVSNIELKNKQKLDVNQEKIKNFIKKVPEKKFDKSQLEEIEIDYVGCELMNQNITNDTISINSHIETINTDISNLNNSILSFVQNLDQNWDSFYKIERERIRSTGIDWNSDESQLTQKMTDLGILLTKYSEEKNKNETTIAKIMEQETLRDELKCTLNAVNNKIIRFQKRIGRKIDGMIQIPNTSFKIIAESDNDLVYDILDSIILTNAHNKEEKIQSILNEIDPKDLLLYITSGNTSVGEKLAELGLTEKNIENFQNKFTCNFKQITNIRGINHKELLEWDRLLNRSKVQFTLQKEGLYKDISDLSPGEKCALVMAIILIKNSRVTIIDQPEDELDYKTRKDLVKMISDKKITSQIIIVTHYQNIPVLSDGDNILLLEEREHKSNIVKQGCFEDMIDNIIDMEGGPDAIKTRFAKYKENLPKY
ncbi:PHP domain-containing protein [Candidatus Lokiarchaeum ossiferum]